MKNVFLETQLETELAGEKTTLDIKFRAKSAQGLEGSAPLFTLGRMEIICIREWKNISQNLIAN